MFWAVNWEVWAHFTEHDSNGHFICMHTAETTAYLLYTNTGTCPRQFWPFWVLFTWRRVIRRQPPFCTDPGSATVKPVIPCLFHPSAKAGAVIEENIVVRFSIRAKCFKFYQCIEQYASSAVKGWMTAVCTVQQHTSVGAWTRQLEEVWAAHEQSDGTFSTNLGGRKQLRPETETPQSV